jgi:hypothetical protein
MTGDGYFELVSATLPLLGEIVAVQSNPPKEAMVRKTPRGC